MKKGTVATGVYYYTYDDETLLIADELDKLKEQVAFANPLVRYSKDEWQHLSFFQMSKGTEHWDLYLTKTAIEVVDLVIEELSEGEFAHSAKWRKDHPAGTYYKVWVPNNTAKVAVENALQRSGIKGRVR